MPSAKSSRLVSRRMARPLRFQDRFTNRSFYTAVDRFCRHFTISHPRSVGFHRIGSRRSVRLATSMCDVAGRRSERLITQWTSRFRKTSSRTVSAVQVREQFVDFAVEEAVREVEMSALGERESAGRHVGRRIRVDDLVIGLLPTRRVTTRRRARICLRNACRA